MVAKEAIRKGTFVAEYAGEVISRDEAVRRTGEMANAAHHYIYTVYEHTRGDFSLVWHDLAMETWAFAGTAQATHVDARLKGNIARFINHSCEPNLFPQVLRIGRMAPPHLCLFALRDIDEGGSSHTLATLCITPLMDAWSLGEELSYCYGPTTTEATTDGAGKSCLCGAPKCSGVLPTAEF